jgi:hypothetical protein
MPRRSNDFQKVVAIVKAHVAEGASVTESKLLTDLVSGEEREVDVCIEGELAGHVVCIGVEVRDKGRPAPVGWVEEMKTKHERLPTGPLVLVSSSGFTKGAVGKAKSYGIETIALGKLDDATAKRLFGTAPSLWVKTFTIEITKVVVEVPADATLPEERAQLARDHAIHSPDGEFLEWMGTYVERVLHLPMFVQQFGAQAEEGHRFFTVRWDEPKASDGRPLCLKKIDPERLRPIKSVYVYGTCEVHVGEFPMKHGMLGDVRVSWGLGEIFEKEALLVGSETEEGNRAATLHIKGPIDKPPR